jgi:nitrate/nitrite transporter NarK
MGWGFAITDCVAGRDQASFANAGNFQTFSVRTKAERADNLRRYWLHSSAAAGGIALINSVGNLGGFFGPYIVEMIKDKTQSNLTALLFLGAALLGMGLFSLMIRPPAARASAAPEIP